MHSSLRASHLCLFVGALTCFIEWQRSLFSLDCFALRGSHGSPGWLGVWLMVCEVRAVAFAAGKRRVVEYSRPCWLVRRRAGCQRPSALLLVRTVSTCRLPPALLRFAKMQQF